MNKRVSYAIIISLIIIALLGMIVSIWLLTSQNRFANEKTIVLNGETTTDMSVNLSGISPGMSVAYEIRLKANTGDTFDITMNFEQTDPGSLAEFIDVEIRLCGETLDCAKLSEYLGGKQVAFSAEFDASSAMDMEIVYSMGLDVGDEAQNTTADFKIVLSAER